MLLPCKPGIRSLQTSKGREESRRLASPTSALAAAAALACVTLAWVGSAAAQNTLPYPCGVVPTADIIAALGTKLGSVAPVLSSVPNVSTCSYAEGSLSISVGTTTIANPALPLKVVTVPGLPTGTYKTYRGSTQTESSSSRAARRRAPTASLETTSRSSRRNSRRSRLRSTKESPRGDRQPYSTTPVKLITG